MTESAVAIIRSYLMFRPYVIFATLAGIFGVLAAIPFARFLIIWVTHGETGGNVQSLIFGSIMSVAALLSVALGVISDLLRTNRILLEDQLERIKEMQYRRPIKPRDLAEERGDVAETRHDVAAARANLGS